MYPASRPRSAKTLMWSKALENGWRDVRKAHRTITNPLGKQTGPILRIIILPQAAVISIQADLERFDSTAFGNYVNVVFVN